MKNYHYYLKQELHPCSSSKRFENVKWHPEQAMTLYLVESGAYPQHAAGLICRNGPNTLVHLGHVCGSSAHAERYGISRRCGW